jgi:hypothetical protein
MIGAALPERRGRRRAWLLYRLGATNVASGRRDLSREARRVRDHAEFRGAE